MPTTAQRVRLSFLESRTQVDVSLPLDIPIAMLTPSLVAMLRPRQGAEFDSAADTAVNDHNGDIWVLSRLADGSRLPPTATLREVDAADGDLMCLTAQSALTVPTLYDDVVDAAARLNKASFVGWDGAAAQAMAFAGVYLVAAVWAFFLTADVFASNRLACVGLSVVAALCLVGAAALAHRSYGVSLVGAALGWAVMPIAGALAWLGLARWGGYGQAGACMALGLIALILFRVIGTGIFGYLTVAVICSIVGSALLARTLGLRTDTAGVTVAVTATLACAGAPRMSARILRSRTGGAGGPEASKPSADCTGAAEQVAWPRVRSATEIRSAIATGLSIAGVLGAGTVVLSPVGRLWSGVVFALTCALAMGLASREALSTSERSGMAIPAVALMVLTCASALRGGGVMPLAAFGVLLASTGGFALVGAGGWAARPPQHARTMLAYLSYLARAALIPLALWVVGAYGRWGIT